jgi:hypothetical protein
MDATQERKVVICDLIAVAVMQQLAQGEGVDLDDSCACADLLVRRSGDVARFVVSCLPRLMEIDQPGGDSAVIERLVLEATTTAWHQLKQEQL